MELIIKGEPKEVADFLVEIHKSEEKVFNCPNHKYDLSGELDACSYITKKIERLKEQTKKGWA